MKQKILYAALAVSVFAQSELVSAETAPVIRTSGWVDRYYGTGPAPVTLDQARAICKGSLWDGLYFVGEDAIRCDWPSFHIQWARVFVCPDSSWALDDYYMVCRRPDNVQPPASEFVNAGADNCQQQVGNPINVGVGNKIEQQIDIALPGLPDLTLIRTYNSRYLPGGPMVSWVTNFHRFAKLTTTNGQNTLEFHRGDGKVYLYRFDGQSWQSSATPQIRITEQKDAQGNTTGWLYKDTGNGDSESYNAQGQLQALTRLNGRQLVFTYSDGTAASGTLTAADGQPTITALDAGLLVRVTDALGHALQFSYNVLGRLYRIQTSSGRSVTYGYSGTGNLIQANYPDGTKRQYLYENTTFPAALTGIINELGQRSLTVTYDSKGRALSTEHAGATNKYEVSYQADGSAKVTDPLGTVRTYSFGNYNGAVKTTDLTQPCPTGCGNSGKHTTYDAQGNTTRILDWNNTATEYAYDPLRGLETRRTEGLKDQTGTSIVQPETRTITTDWHTSLPLPLTVSEYTGGVNASGQPTGGLQKQTVYTYDAQGNPLTRTEKSGSDSRQWRRAYASLGRVTAVTKPDGSSVQYAYYPDDDSDLGKRGQLKQTTNSAGHITQVSAYSADGQPTRIVDVNGKVSEVTYDTRGRAISQQNGGQHIDYTYDASGRLTRAQANDGTRLDYTYDSAGRLTSVSDQKGNRIDYTLDNLGNRTGETVSGPGGQRLKQIARQYNLLNQLQQISGNE